MMQRVVNTQSCQLPIFQINTGAPQSSWDEIAGEGKIGLFNSRLGVGLSKDLNTNRGAKIYI